MKSFFVFFVIFFVTIGLTFGNELEFELFGTDYSSMLHSGNTILIYGKYGIITYSNDLGVSWKQSYIGQNDDILKIISIDDKFYALTPKKIYVSKDKGKLWEATTVHWDQDFVDISTDGNKIFIITDNEILSIGKELGSALEVLFQFEPFIKFTEMTIWKNYLFIIDAKTAIIKFNIQTNTPEDTLFTGFSTRQIERLKFRDSTLYVLLLSDMKSPEFKLRYQLFRHEVLCSEDLGRSWRIFASGIPVTRDYLIEGSEAHTLSPKLLFGGQYPTVSYVKANSQGLFEENDLTEPNCWLPYFQFTEDANTFQINAIERMNDSIIVACGSNKTILISKDNGKRWIFASYFRPIYSPSFYDSNINQIIQRGRDTIVVLAYYQPYMFASFDGGATFRTLGIDTNFSKHLSGYSCLVIPPNGQLGYFTFQKGNYGHPTGTITIVKLNFVNNEYKTDTFSLKHNEFIKWDSIEFVIFPQPLYFKEQIFIVAYLYESHNSSRSSLTSSLIFVLDKNLRVIDTLFLPKDVPVPQLSDGNYLYSISSDSENTNVLRTISLKGDWEIVARIPRASYERPNEKTWLSLKKVINNYFIFTKTNSQYNLLFFDKYSGHLDSIIIPSYPRVFSLGDTIFVLTNEWLREFPNLPLDTSFFIEYQLPDIAGSKINNIFHLENQNYISFEKKYGMYSEYLEGNFGELKWKSSIPTIVIEEVKPFLFCFPPYPNPALSYINLGVCWDLGFSMNDIKFSFFNVNGQKLEVPYSLDQYNFRCGVLRFFLNNLPPSVYFVNVKLQNSEWTVPFVKTN